MLCILQMCYEFTVIADISVENPFSYKNKLTTLIKVKQFLLLSTLKFII